MRIDAVLVLVRPRQWLKNMFVFAPLIFSRHVGDRPLMVAAIGAAGLFCLASSAGYVLNDLVDRDADRLHPGKRLSRPLAAGTLTPRSGILVFVALAVLTIAGLVALPALAAVVGAYLALSAGYSLVLKRFAVVDLFAVAAGFVLRVLGGALAIGVPLSSWMLITTLCLALYLAAAKRLAEVRAVGNVSRAVLTAYSEPLLAAYTERAAVGAMVFYALFVVTTRPELALTVPVVLFGLYRHSLVAERSDLGESPTDAVWRDPLLLLTVIVWVAWCVLALGTT